MMNEEMRSCRIKSLSLLCSINVFGALASYRQLKVYCQPTGVPHYSDSHDDLPIRIALTATESSP
jgi:hypothetical protein